MEEFVVILIFALVICLYFLPSIVAFKRKHRYKLPIFVLNIFAYTGMLWIVILVWAVMPQDDFFN